MGLFDTLSGKAVASKLEEYIELFGEVLLGLHRDLENQERLLHDYEQRLESQAQLFREQVAALADSSSNLQNRLEQFQTQVTARFDSLHTTVEQFQSEKAELAVARENLSRLARDLTQRSVSVEKRLAAQDEANATFAVQATQIQQLRLLCICSYVFFLGLGIALWLIR